MNIKGHTAQMAAAREATRLPKMEPYRLRLAEDVTGESEAGRCHGCTVAALLWMGIEAREMTISELAESRLSKFFEPVAGSRTIGHRSYHGATARPVTIRSRCRTEALKATRV